MIITDEQLNEELNRLSQNMTWELQDPDMPLIKVFLVTVIAVAVTDGLVDPKIGHKIIPAFSLEGVEAMIRRDTARNLDREKFPAVSITVTELGKPSLGAIINAVASGKSSPPDTDTEPTTLPIREPQIPTETNFFDRNTTIH